jgi:hypothetical protein
MIDKSENCNYNITNVITFGVDNMNLRDFFEKTSSDWVRYSKYEINEKTGRSISLLPLIQK